jgi:uncharacterized protein
MILDLRGIEEFPAQVRVVAAGAELHPFSSDVRRVEVLHADLAIQKAEEEYFIQGRTFTRVGLECARCLREYAAELIGQTDFIVCSDQRPETDRRVRDDEEYVYFHGSDLRVDVFEPVRQSVLLEVPLMPLCEEDCKGLCPRCGANLNETACRCAPPETDSRWEGLKGFLKG